jgi:peptidyl-prolyl cis-trans isomerase D
MLNKLRGFSNTKLAGVLIAIIIIPFVFWGMGSVFSGGNTNNVGKINNETISTQDFIRYINQTRMDTEYIKNNINNNVIENILSKIVSKKLLDMEINDLNISISDKTLANKIRSNEVFLDDKNKFSRIKYEKFLLENNLTAPGFEIRFKNEELKKNLFSYVGGGIKSPYFLNNKIYINKTKKVEIDYFNLDNVYDTETPESQIDQFIKDNVEKLKEEFINFSYAKITPSNLIEIDEFNNEFFKKIDDIENSILNGFNIEDIQKKYNLKLEYFNNYKNDQEEDVILKEIYQKKNVDKIQLIDKNDYYLLFEISNIEKTLPNKSNLNFINRVKNNLVLKKKYDYNKDLFQKIQDKTFNEDEFLKISNGIKNIQSIIINSLDDDKIFDKESIKLVYSLPINSFVLITDVNNKIYLAKINNIFTKNLPKNDINNKDYLVKSNSKILDEIYSSYDLSLNRKYKVKVFKNTLDRIKNNFK